MNKIIIDATFLKGQLSFHDILMTLFAQDKKNPYIASFDSDFDKVEGIRRIKNKRDIEMEL